MSKKTIKRNTKTEIHRSERFFHAEEKELNFIKMKKSLNLYVYVRISLAHSLVLKLNLLRCAQDSETHSTISSSDAQRERERGGYYRLTRYG